MHSIVCGPICYRNLGSVSKNGRCPLSVCSSARKKDGDLAAALSRATGLESELNQSAAALSTALSQNAALTSELVDVKGLLAKVRMD